MQTRRDEEWKVFFCFAVCELNRKERKNLFSTRQIKLNVVAIKYLFPPIYSFYWVESQKNVHTKEYKFMDDVGVWNLKWKSSIVKWYDNKIHKLNSTRVSEWVCEREKYIQKHQEDGRFMAIVIEQFIGFSVYTQICVSLFLSTTAKQFSMDCHITNK